MPKIPTPSTPPRPKRTASTHTRVRSLAHSQTSTPISNIFPTPPAATYFPASHDAAAAVADNDDPLSFSPSKARQHLHQTQQQTQLTAWLEILFSSESSSSSVILERFKNSLRRGGNGNTETAVTKYLQELMGVNVAADEMRRLVFEAVGEEVGGSESMMGRGRGGMLLDELEGRLDDRAHMALESLGRSAVLLASVPGCGLEEEQTVMSTLAAGLWRHTVLVQRVEREAEELRALRQKLARREAEVRTGFEGFERDKKEAEAEAEEVMRPRTAQWNRDTKQIGVKIQEYRDRIVGLERGRPGSETGQGGSEEMLVGVEDVVEMQERVHRRRENVKRLEERVKVLNGLPPDLEASRNEVKRARTELERLKARREELFGLLAERQ